MKTIKYILCIVCLIVCFSCSSNKVDDLFDQLPEQRTATIKAKYQKILTDASYGWKTYFSTSNNIGRWLILMKFDKDGKVMFKCDPIDYYFKKGIDIKDIVTYRVDFLQFPELVIESFSQFSVWNELPVDADGDGYADKYAGPETQFIIEKYQDGKLYMKGKSNIGIGKSNSEIITSVFEPAEESDWNLEGIADVKKAINYNSLKGKFQRLSYNNSLLDDFFFIDADNRLVIYRTLENGKDVLQTLPFYITKKGFSLVNGLKIKNVGVARDFNVNLADGSISEASIPSLKVVYTDKNSASQRTPFSIFDRLYLGIEVYHATGDPIGRSLKAYFDALRPPYVDKQHLNVIYFAKNIDKDMGKKPFKYTQELTLIYADTDPAYSDKDLYGKNPTFVRIPVEFETTADRMWTISAIGSIEKAFIEAYPQDETFAKQKAKEALPMLSRLFSEKGWGMYAQGLDTSNPTVKVIDEDDIVGSFFTLYPYSQEDVNKSTF